MNIEELKQKFIDKTAVMLDEVKTYDDLHSLAEVYSELTKEDWSKLVLETLNKGVNDNSTEPFKSGFAFPPINELEINNENTGECKE